MHDKWDFPQQLPSEIDSTTVPKSKSDTLISNGVGFFKPSVEDSKLLFQDYVVLRNYEKVKEMLEKNIDLIYKKDKVIDCSGRIFESISGFEFMLWALDKHMWTIVLDCVVKSEKKNEVIAKLLVQYYQVITKGVTYTLNGISITERHFDFENTIITELQKQVEYMMAPGTKDWVNIDKHWRERVGGAQKLLPMHVVTTCYSGEYYNPRPISTYQEEPSMQFYNSIDGQWEDWFSEDSKLGVNLAVCNGRGHTWSPDMEWNIHNAAIRVATDLGSLTSLYRVRTQEFVDLELLLKEHMTLDNQAEIFQI